MVNRRYIFKLELKAFEKYGIVQLFGCDNLMI